MELGKKPNGQKRGSRDSEPASTIELKVDEPVRFEPYVGAIVILKRRNNNLTIPKDKIGQAFLIPVLVTEVHGDGLTIDGLAMTTRPIQVGMGGDWEPVYGIVPGSDFGEWEWPSKRT